MSSRTRTPTNPGPLWRSRWAALGAAVAIVAGGGVITAHAVSGPQAMAFVPVVPCRLVDTRTGIGSSLRAAPLSRDVVGTFAAHGRQASCDLPATAASLMANITVVNPVTDGFLVAYSADEEALPVTSNINWVAGQPPIGNQGIIDLSPSGMFHVYASSGEVDVVIDVVGYYVPGSAGANGAQGDRGATGATGATGLPGSVGAAGADGDDGLPGSVGATGADGDDGLPGSVGATGADGDDGLPGSVGATGADGDDGLPGPRGTDAVRGECTIGQVSLTAGPIRSNMLATDGQSLLRANYAALFGVIGTTFGSSGVDKFNLPLIDDVGVGLRYTICFTGFAPPLT